MPAGGVSRIPYFRYSSDNVYKLEYPFYGIVGGHSDRTNTTSLYVMEVDRIYKIYATSGNTISFKKDSDRNVYASGGDGGFMLGGGQKARVSLARAIYQVTLCSIFFLFVYNE